MIKLFVQGVQLDLFKSEIFAVSKAVSKLGEFNLRHGDVSINFNVPSTAKNVATFGNISDLNNFNKNAFRRFDGELIEDESIISSGYFQVLKINPAEAKIEIRFYGGNSDWFDLIKKRDINGTYRNEEIGTNRKSYNLQYLNHKFEPAPIKSSWDNEDGYFYFPVDNGKNTTKANNTLDITDFQVGVFQHTIVKHIFDSIGIKLNGTLLNDPLYYNTLVNRPVNVSDFDRQNNEKRFRPPVQPLVGIGGANVPTPLIFNENDFDTQWNGTKFTAGFDTDETGFVIELVTTKDDVFFNAGNASIDYEIRLNNLIIEAGAMFPLNDNNDRVTFNTLPREFADVGGDFPSLSIGDTVEFYFQGNYPESNAKINLVKSNDGNGNISRLDYSLVGAITPYDITNAIPKINQGDFVKDVMFRHGAVSQYNSKTRTLTINKFQNIEENKPNAVDLSPKIDLANAPVFDFTKVLNNFRKTSRIVYKQDDSDLLMSLFRSIFKRNLGDAVLPIDNDNLTGEGTIYESEFSGTLQSWSWSDNFYLPTLPIFKPTDGGDFELQDLNARIFVKAGKIPVNSFNSNGYTNIVFDGNNEGDIGYAFFAKQQLTRTGLTDKSLNSNTETLAFENVSQSTTNYIGRTLIEKNYGLYFNILDNPIHLTINLNLDALDIQNLDFFTPVWLNFSLDSGYYYLDNISQYKGDGTTTSIELIKI